MLGKEKFFPKGRICHLGQRSLPVQFRYVVCSQMKARDPPGDAPHARLLNFVFLMAAVRFRNRYKLLGDMKS